MSCQVCLIYNCTYREYLKRDDQAMILRQLAEDLAKAKEQQKDADPKPVDDDMDVDGKEDEDSEEVSFCCYMFVSSDSC